MYDIQLPSEIQSLLGNSTVIIIVLILVTVLSYLIKTQLNTDYSDQTGYVNLRYFKLGCSIIAVVIIFITISYLIGISLNKL